MRFDVAETDTVIHLINNAHVVQLSAPKARNQLIYLLLHKRRERVHCSHTRGERLAVRPALQLVCTSTGAMQSTCVRVTRGIAHFCFFAIQRTRERPRASSIDMTARRHPIAPARTRVTAALVLLAALCCCSGASSAANTTSTTAPPPDLGPTVGDTTATDSDQPLCLGFLLPDTRSVVASATCAFADGHPVHRAATVLIGANQAPVVLDIASFAAHEQPLNIGDSSQPFRLAVGSITQPLASPRDANAVAFSSPPTQPQSARDQRMTRYSVQRRPRTNSGRANRIIDAASIALTHSEFVVVVTRECEIAMPQLAPSIRALSSAGRVVCGKSQWASIDACRAASTAKGRGESDLVTIKLRDTEFALGFVVDSAPCSADASSLFVAVSAVATLQGEISTSYSSVPVSMLLLVLECEHALTRSMRHVLDNTQVQQPQLRRRAHRLALQQAHQ